MVQREQNLAMIGIVDYGMGNLRSVYNAVYEQGFDPVLVKSAEDFDDCTHFILPGVGHFKQAMAAIQRLGFDHALHEQVRQQGKPLLGICLGMQLLRSHGEEGDCEGLGFIEGDVKKFTNSNLRVPHVGWNEVNLLTNTMGLHPVLQNIKNHTDFYFVHSYYCAAKEPEHALGTTDYGHNFHSIIANGNIIGMQFHPEKSQANGLTLIEQFCDWDGQC
mgnify:CR=1 FL=1